MFIGTVFADDTANNNFLIINLNTTSSITVEGNVCGSASGISIGCVDFPALTIPAYGSSKSNMATVSKNLVPSKRADIAFTLNIKNVSISTPNGIVSKPFIPCSTVTQVMTLSDYGDNNPYIICK